MARARVTGSGSWYHPYGRLRSPLRAGRVQVSHVAAYTRPGQTTESAVALRWTTDTLPDTSSHGVRWVQQHCSSQAPRHPQRKPPGRAAIGAVKVQVGPPTRIRGPSARGSRACRAREPTGAAPGFPVGRWLVTVPGSRLVLGQSGARIPDETALLQCSLSRVSELPGCPGSDGVLVRRKRREPSAETEN